MYISHQERFPYKHNTIHLDNINVTNKINKLCIVNAATEVHPIRINYGYKTCVPCSTVEDYSYVPIID